MCVCVFPSINEYVYIYVMCMCVCARVCFDSINPILGETQVSPVFWLQLPQ